MTNPAIGGAKKGGWFSRLLDDKLPKRTKRLVFLASLTARLKGSDAFDNETLRKLNKLMVLANSDSALKLPVQLSKAIWHGQTSIEVLHDSLVQSEDQVNVLEIVRSIMQAMPTWLRYDSEETIEREISQLLSNRNLVLGR